MGSNWINLEKNSQSKAINEKSTRSTPNKGLMYRSRESSRVITPNSFTFGHNP